MRGVCNSAADGRLAVLTAAGSFTDEYSDRLLEACTGRSECRGAEQSGALVRGRPARAVLGAENI